jgi:hypothetical protein
MLPSDPPRAIEDRRAWLAEVRAALADAERSALILLEHDEIGGSAQVLLGRLAIIRAELDLLEHITLPVRAPRSFRRPVEDPRHPQTRP